MKENFNFIVTKYFQKSMFFLFPLLSIKRNEKYKPEETYICWKEKNINECSEVLIVTYRKEDSEAFRRFEKRCLLNNKLFKDYIECEDGIGAYLFTFEQYSDDWLYFLEGKYSKFSSAFKNSILQFVFDNSTDTRTISSYLYPEKYLETYARYFSDAEEVTEMMELLKGVGELCDAYNIEKETMIYKENKTDNIFDLKNGGE